MKTIIENEVRAISELKKNGNHSHLIAVAGHGWLRSPPHYFFFDMELCDLNLDKYIHGERPVMKDMKTAIYVSKDSKLLVRMSNVWTIMSHIAKGLGFMHNHGQVHRDLKPRNSMALSGNR
jgi:serine/threonine protein kinase